MAKEKRKRRKILFVCTGNTCRSPVAEALLKKKIKARKIRFVDIASAGLSVTEDRINPLSEKLLTENGIFDKKFKPRQLSDKIISGAFVIITMTDRQKEQFSGVDKLKTYSMSEVTDGMEIPDPYGLGEEAYQKMYSSLDEATDRIIKNIWD